MTSQMDEDIRADVEAGSVLLEAQNLAIRYGGVVAVDDVSLTVHAGEVVGLVGPNGAGKTTLVDLITGAQKADSGSLAIRGVHVRGSTAKRARMGLARTYQHPLLAPEMTVIENLVAGLSAHRFTSVSGMVSGLVRGVWEGPGPDYQAAAAIADQLNIAGLDRLCSELSLGEQRLVEVGRAYAQNPAVMLLDEPFAGADADSLGGMIDAITTVRESNRGVLLVDHNVDLIAELADRVVLLERGQVVFDGNPQECLASTEMKRVYFGGEVDA